MSFGLGILTLPMKKMTISLVALILCFSATTIISASSVPFASWQSFSPSVPPSQSSPFDIPFTPQLCDLSSAKNEYSNSVLSWQGENSNPTLPPSSIIYALDWSENRILESTDFPSPPFPSHPAVPSSSVHSRSGAFSLLHSVGPTCSFYLTVGGFFNDNSTYLDDVQALYVDQNTNNYTSSPTSPSIHLFSQYVKVNLLPSLYTHNVIIPPAAAWGNTLWLDESGSELTQFIFGGTRYTNVGGNNYDYVDSSNIYLAYWSGFPTTCSGNTSSTVLSPSFSLSVRFEIPTNPSNSSISYPYGLGVLPPGISGGRSVYSFPYFFLTFGYTCTHGGLTSLGGNVCFNSNVYRLNLDINDPNGHYLQWDIPSVVNPLVISPRAWHSATLYSNQIWVFGGIFIDSTATQYFYNDVTVYDIGTNQWLFPTIRGQPPPVLWSHTATLIQDYNDSSLAFSSSSSELDPTHSSILIAGGCQSSTYNTLWYILRLQRLVTNTDCEVGGNNIMATTAGEPSTLTVTCVNPFTMLPIPYSSGLLFGISIVGINEKGILSELPYTSSYDPSTFTYNYTYIPIGGSLNDPLNVLTIGSPSSSCNNLNGFSIYGGAENTPLSPSTVTISISLDQSDLPNSPFTSTISAYPSSFSPSQSKVPDGVISSLPVQGQLVGFPLYIGDQYGNLVSVSSNDTQMVNLLINGQDIPFTITLSSTTPAFFLVSYVVPYTDQYILSIMVDSEDVEDSPFSISPIPSISVSPSLVLFFRILSSLVCIYLLLLSFLLYRMRNQAAVKSASPKFLALILMGCFVTLIVMFTDPNSHTFSTCNLFSWCLSIGFDITYGSLSAKTFRIYRIFLSKKIKLVRISDTKLLIPLVIYVSIELIFFIVWIAADPLHPTQELYSNNIRIVITECNSHYLLSFWYPIILISKGILLVFSLFLAISIRSVIAAFNESRYVMFAVINLAFSSSLALPLVFLLQQQLQSLYLIKSVLILWGITFTSGILFLPKFLGMGITSTLKKGNTQMNITNNGGGVGGVGGNTKSSLNENFGDVSSLSPDEGGSTDDNDKYHRSMAMMEPKGNGDSVGRGTGRVRSVHGNSTDDGGKDSKDAVGVRNNNFISPMNTGRQSQSHSNRHFNNKNTSNVNRKSNDNDNIIEYNNNPLKTSVKVHRPSINHWASSSRNENDPTPENALSPIASPMSSPSPSHAMKTQNIIPYGSAIGTNDNGVSQLTVQIHSVPTGPGGVVIQRNTLPISPTSDNGITNANARGHGPGRYSANGKGKSKSKSTPNSVHPSPRDEEYNNNSNYHHSPTQQTDRRELTMNIPLQFAQSPTSHLTDIDHVEVQSFRSEEKESDKENKNK